MPYREKVMSWLEGLTEPDWRECYSDSEVQETARQALDLIDELLKEQEAQKFFVDESGKITPLPVVIRCKDCKHGEKANDVYLCGKPRGFGLAHEPNWFCADGERR